MRDRRDEKRREKRRAEVAAEVGRFLEFSDYEKAEAAIRDGRADLPGDPALDELARQFAERRDHSDETAKLLRQARAAREAKNWQAAAIALRQAYQLASSDREVRAEYLCTLTHIAREQTDPAKARLVANEGLRVDPAHAGLRGLAHQADLQWKDADVQPIIERAQDALAIGHFSEAMSAVDEGVCIAPGHELLERMQQAINAGFTRQSDLAMWHRIQVELNTPAASVELVRTHLAVVHQIAARSGGDHRIAVLSEDLAPKFSCLMTRLEISTGESRVTRIDLQTPISSRVVEMQPAAPARCTKAYIAAAGGQWHHIRESHVEEVAVGALTAP